MKERKQSLSAEMCASGRAFESSLPEKERVCYDPLAKYFISTKYRIWLCKSLHLRNIALSYTERILPGCYGESVARTRYIDNCLEKCIDDGIKQLVILGAGYDSRAYRFAELGKKVKVFEVDHPATQKIKLNKIKKIFGSLPNHVVYVPIDFGKEKLDSRLFENSYDRNIKTLFIWEGVSEYLTAAAVDDVLAFVVKNSGQGSSIIIDYYFQSAIDGTSELEEARKIREFFAQRGEPFTFGIDEEAVDKFFFNRGFDQVRSVAGYSLEAEYFRKIGRNTSVTHFYGITHATIG